MTKTLIALSVTLLLGGWLAWRSPQALAAVAAQPAISAPMSEANSPTPSETTSSVEGLYFLAHCAVPETVTHVSVLASQL